MRVKVSELQEGYRIIKRIDGLTRKPIIPENTIVTPEIIEVLNAFLIDEVEVEVINKKNPQKHTKKQEKTKKSNTEQSQGSSKFQEVYLKAVEEYKKEFIHWQSGGSVKISAIRQIIIPLLEQLEKNPINILLLQNYVNNHKDYVYHHSIAVGLISGYIAKRMNLGKGEYYQIALAGCLSDCGMAKVNPLILQKKVLNVVDRKEIYLHPAYSYKMLQDISTLNNGAKLAVLQHHERMDGSGYPLKDKGNKIHLYARIVTVADVYHAMICNRVYKPKVSPFRAVEVMEYEQFGRFDVKVLQTLISCITPLSINAIVKLSSNQIGRILFIDQKYPTRPIIQLLSSQEVIRLAKKKDLNITEIYFN